MAKKRKQKVALITVNSDHEWFINPEINGESVGYYLRSSEYATSHAKAVREARKVAREKFPSFKVRVE